MLELIAKTHDLDLDGLYKLTKVKKPSAFASDKAKMIADKANLKPGDIPHEGAKITADDVRRKLGEPVKTKKPSAFASVAAKKLAAENNLTEKDFKDKDRTGRARKSGEKTIRLEDIKIKLGLSSPRTPWASPQAKELAKKRGVKASAIRKEMGIEGKIKKSEIEAYLLKIDDSSSSSESENEEK